MTFFYLKYTYYGPLLIQKSHLWTNSSKAKNTSDQGLLREDGETNQVFSF